MKIFIIIFLSFIYCNSYCQNNYFVLDFYFNGKLKTPHKVEIFNADSNKISTTIKGDTIFLLDSIPPKRKNRVMIIYYSNKKSIGVSEFLLCDNHMFVAYFDKKLKHPPKFDSPIAYCYNSINWVLVKRIWFNESCGRVNIYSINK